MTQHLDIGKIANTHGIKGELKIIPLTDDPSRFEDIDWLYIEINNSLQKYNIESVKYLKSLIVLKFKEINDMSEAEKLKGCFLKISSNILKGKKRKTYNWLKQTIEKEKYCFAWIIVIFFICFIYSFPQCFLSYVSSNNCFIYIISISGRA